MNTPENLEVLFLHLGISGKVQLFCSICPVYASTIASTITLQKELAMKNNLSPNEAMILQQVYEDGEDDIRSLAYELGITRHRTITEILQLEQKGLLDLHYGFDGLLLQVSRRGRRLVRQLWPDAQPIFA